jgi:hypothetical protein
MRAEDLNSFEFKRSFGLCGRSPAVAAVFGALSPHPKIPFPAAGFGTKSVRTCSGNSAFCAAVIQGSLVDAAIIPN